MSIFHKSFSDYAVAFSIQYHLLTIGDKNIWESGWVTLNFERKSRFYRVLITRSHLESLPFVFVDSAAVGGEDMPADGETVVSIPPCREAGADALDTFCAATA